MGLKNILFGHKDKIKIVTNKEGKRNREYLEAPKFITPDKIAQIHYLRNLMNEKIKENNSYDKISLSYKNYGITIEVK